MFDRPSIGPFVSLFLRIREIVPIVPFCSEVFDNPAMSMYSVLVGLSECMKDASMHYIIDRSVFCR